MIRLILTAAFAVLISGMEARADSPVPGEGFTPDHYEPLWTKSPFAVASADAPATSPDFKLEGLGRTDGISYAVILDTGNNDHFIVTTEKPVRGVTLVSISHGRDPSETSAIIKKDGEPLTLKLEHSTQTAGPLLPMENGAVPMVSTPPTWNGGGIGGQGGLGGGAPPARFRPRMTIHLPPSPSAQPGAGAAPAPAPATTP
jgi:hypothetical protein